MYAKRETGTTTKTCWRGASKGSCELRRLLGCSEHLYLRGQFLSGLQAENGLD